jgi:hypothetical protein
MSLEKKLKTFYAEYMIVNKKELIVYFTRIKHLFMYEENDLISSISFIDFVRKEVDKNLAKIYKVSQNTQKCFKFVSFN